VAELVDALASGASGFTAVKVRVLSWAPLACSQLFAIIQKWLEMLGISKNVVTLKSFPTEADCTCWRSPMAENGGGWLTGLS
jgi:hypothetical protein